MCDAAFVSELLPEQTGDDRDLGWGELPEGEGGDGAYAPGDPTDDPDLRRFLDERPPHHGD